MLFKIKNDWFQNFHKICNWDIMGRKKKHWYLGCRQVGSIPTRWPYLRVIACLKREEQGLQLSLMKYCCKHIGTATGHPTQRTGEHVVTDFQADLWQMTYCTPFYLSSTSQAQERLYGRSSRLYFLHSSFKMMLLKFTFISLKSFLAFSFLMFLWHYSCADSTSSEQHHLCDTDYRRYVYFKQYVFKQDGFPPIRCISEAVFPHIVYACQPHCKDCLLRRLRAKALWSHTYVLRM